MSGSTIQIDSPASGSTVSPTILVNGVYTSQDQTVMINLALKDSAGTTIAMSGSMGSGGVWSGSLSPPPGGYINASITADIAGTGASATVTDITVL